jgi:hypothetical protein
MDWYDIKQIGISDNDFSKITNKNSLFINYMSLTSIIFPKNIISIIKTMKKRFYNCSSLFSIDLPNFLTLNYILYSCLSMPSIDLSNFGFQNIITIERLLKLVNILKILI